MCLIAIGGLGGCTVDHTKVEDGIRQQLAGDKVAVKSVTCPTGKRLKDGETFECTATDADGHDAIFNVVIKGKKAEWTTDAKLVTESIVGHELEKGVSATAVFECPEKVVLMMPGQTFSCMVTGSAHNNVTITMVNKTRFTWKLE